MPNLEAKEYDVTGKPLPAQGARLRTPMQEDPNETPTPGAAGAEESGALYQEALLSEAFASEVAGTSPVTRVRELGIWLALTSLVAMILLLNQLAPAPELLADDPAGGLELRIQARYALGADALTKVLGSDALSGQLVDQLRQTVKTPAAGVCVVPVIAELSGFEAALEEIARLRLEEGLAEEEAADLKLLEQIYARSPAPLDLEARAAFAGRRDYFAELALSHVEGADATERDALLAEAKRTAAVLMAMVGGVATATLVGLVLLVIAGLMLRQGSLVSGYLPKAGEDALTARLPFFETLVVFILATLGFGLLSGLLQQGLGLETTWVLLVNMLALPAVFWPLLRGASGDGVRRAFGWHSGAGFWREVASGLVGYVAGAPVLLAALGVSVVLANWLETQPSHPLVEEVAGAGWGEIVVIFLLASVWAPLIEESVFRGGFYHYLRGRLGILAAAFVSSFVFAVIHPQGIVGVPPLVALAMILALIREWRGSLVASVAVHAVHNGLAMTALFFMLG